MNFRIAKQDDLAEMKQLFVDTIHSVCKDQYNESQLSAWSSSSQNDQRWQELISTQYVLIAELNDKIVGFASLKDGNYIDFFYVHKDFQRKGIAKELLLRIESEAASYGTLVLTSDVSMTAKPFFEKNGFLVVKEQENLRKDVVLINYKMMKETKD